MKPPRRATAGLVAHNSPHVSYAVAIENGLDHFFSVVLTIADPQAEQILQLPAWIPGSYLLREFARHLQGLTCKQGGKSLPVQQLDKARWRVACVPGQPLVLHYQVYAFDASVRTAWLDATRGFFNGTSLLLKVLGKELLPHTLEVLQPESLPGWSLATGLAPLRVNRAGFGCYGADDYATLVDCPVEMGPFWSGAFSVRGVAHRFVVAGATERFDGDRLLADARTICEQEMQFWHGPASSTRGKPPFKSYVFLLNAVHDGYGGLEHANSTALICPRKDLPTHAPAFAATPGQAHRQPDGYTTLLGLISHEYFHTWNVKRLRPAEFLEYDLGQENYTELLWFFEGFTSYYDDLLLRRAGLIDDATYLKLLSKTINQVLQTPGRHVQTVAQASFDAWTKFYRPDENTANATVSYYTKGALVALCLDLTLRTEGTGTLDAVMSALWKRCAGGPMAQSDLLEALQATSGRSYAREITQWVHTTRDLPLQALLEQQGIEYKVEADQLAQQLGIRVKEAGGVQIQQVLRHSAAERAGFAAGDEWLAVQAAKRGASGPWRLMALDDVTQYCGQAKKLVATVARDRQLHTLSLTIPTSSNTVRLVLQDAARARQWLESPEIPT